MVIGKLLTSRHKTVCTAESCTGGNIAWMLTSVPGSSNYFQGSIVAYSNRIKNEILGVDNNIFEREGAVSETVVLRMAESARRLLKTDYCVATSGIAGPDGGTQQKPVGTLCIAVSSDSGTVSETHTFGTERIHNIRRFSLAAMNLLRTQILRSC
jgi:nicotinamide-nucleotide amidase